jgi:hypothetical protein
MGKPHLPGLVYDSRITKNLGLLRALKKDAAVESLFCVEKSR